MGKKKKDTWRCGEQVLSVEQVQLAIKNGLSKKIVYARLELQGWETERALTEPVHPRSKTATKGGYTKADVDEADANGIYYKAFTSRIFNGHWTVQEAKTIPLGEKRVRKQH